MIPVYYIIYLKAKWTYCKTFHMPFLHDKQIALFLWHANTVLIITQLILYFESLLFAHLQSSIILSLVCFICLLSLFIGIHTVYQSILDPHFPSQHWQSNNTAQVNLRWWIFLNFSQTASIYYKQVVVALELVYRLPW